jgi:hypothetical protein
MTERSMGRALPLGETITRLGRSNLGHFVYVRDGSTERLVAYTLNEVYTALVGGRPATVNYFCSAFILPEYRGKYALYRTLGPMRLVGREDFLLMRTQSPLTMSGFWRLCRDHGFRVYTALNARVPAPARRVVRLRFENDVLIHKTAYPTRVSPPSPPRTARTRRLMDLIDPERGDAVVFVAERRPSRREAPRVDVA